MTKRTVVLDIGSGPDLQATTGYMYVQRYFPGPDGDTFIHASAQKVLLTNPPAEVDLTVGEFYTFTPATPLGVRMTARIPVGSGSILYNELTPVDEDTLEPLPEHQAIWEQIEEQLLTIETSVADAVTVAAAAQTDIDGHEADHNNPHTVTKAQVGLGAADNTADSAKPVSGPQQAALDAKATTTALTAETTARGDADTTLLSNITAEATARANAVTTINTTLGSKADLVGGTVPANQLPSYVDDVLEFANLAAFPAVGETGKIYVAKDTNLTYRWSGSAYGALDPSLALGETTATAYRGDRGKVAYDHSQTTGNPHGLTRADIGAQAAATLDADAAALVPGATALGAAVAAKIATVGEPIYAPRKGLPLISDVVVADEVAVTGVRPMEQFGGYLWGTTPDNKIWRSNDGATTWTQIGSTPPTRFFRFLPNTAGELVAHNGLHLYKSTGWAANPATATWAIVGLPPNGSSTFQMFGFDGYGNNFIVAEYASPTRADSHYVQISTDGGATWAVKWDTNVQFPTTHDESHLHAACYDRWADRFIISEGHGGPKGIYYSDDHGTTWTRMTGGMADLLEPTPTVIVATDDGYMCGTDADVYSTYGIDRTTMAMYPLLRWQVDHDATVGFGQYGVRNPDDGLVYISFYSSSLGVYPVVVAGTPFEADLIWTAPDSDIDSRVWAAFVDKGKFVAHTATTNNATQRLAIGKAYRGARRSPSLADKGNVGGGDTLGINTSVAVGPQAKTNGYPNGVALGTKANANGGVNGKAVAVGYQANATGNSSIALGYLAAATGDTSVSVGPSSTDGGFAESVAIGASAAATAAAGTAVGRSAVANAGAVAVGKAATAASSGTAVGFTATALATSVAIGREASTGSTQTVAVGYQASASASSAVAVGNTALAAGSGAVAVGLTAKANNSGAVAIGQNTVAGSASVVIGGSATATTFDSAVALGVGASVTGAEGTALGRSATASQTGLAVGKSASAVNLSAALGHTAVAAHTSSVALGQATTTTATAQVQVGIRHFEMKEITAPAAGGADTGRLFVQDNGAGKTQLCVIFNTGAVQVIATQP